MCRRIITHHMHHDVAAPMIMDPISKSPVTCANPLRTNFHRCELSPPPPNWMLNTPILKCRYHSCCVPYERVEHCADLLAYLDVEGEEDSLEPEECDAFILEHHHERLPYFGHEAVYDEPTLATWGNVAHIRGNNPDWFPHFAHEPYHRAKWEKAFFTESERLCTLVNDARILHEYTQDLIYSDSCSWNMVRDARANYLKAEGALLAQRKLVSEFTEWALEPCDTCCR
jgi:hypothetical protein